MSHVASIGGETECTDQMEYAGGGPALADTLCPDGGSAPADGSPWSAALSGSSEISWLLAHGA